MHQLDRKRLLADMHSDDNGIIADAAKGLLQLGEFGTPAGTYQLRGAKAALRTGRLADAAVLTYHGLQAAAPNTPTWADLLVNRAIACAQHGFCQDAIDAGMHFLGVVEAFPEFTKWCPYAHHAIGLAYDRLYEYGKAVSHHRAAAEMYESPARRMASACDLAYSLTLDGAITEADLVLSQVNEVDDQEVAFVVKATTALVRYHQGQYAEAAVASEQAERLASGKEDVWAVPLAELRYWSSRTAWEMGDRYQAAALAYMAAVSADKNRHFRLLKAANEWLANIMTKGGVVGA